MGGIAWVNGWTFFRETNKVFYFEDMFEVACPFTLLRAHRWDIFNAAPHAEGWSESFLKNSSRIAKG